MISGAKINVTQISIEENYTQTDRNCSQRLVETIAFCTAIFPRNTYTSQNHGCLCSG